MQHPTPALIARPSLFRKLALMAMAAVTLLISVPQAHADRLPANCAGSGLGISLFTSIPDVHIGDTLFYSINVFNGIANSGRIACDATEIKAFIVTPDGKTNAVTLRRTTLHQGDADFYPDVVAYVVRAQDIHPDGTLLATARDVGNIHQNDVDSLGGGFQGVNTQVNEPCIKITALCFGGIGENGAITFTGTVTNCGNNTLVGVTVTNFVNNGAIAVLFPTNLAVGQTANFSGSWIPLNPCGPNTALLTVRATDEFTSTPQTVTNFTTVTCQNTVTPGIKVTKVCPPLPVAPGQLLTFSGTVVNTGNITLTNIVVVNNQPSANTQVFALASLAPGATASFSGSYLAPTNCSVSDTLTARASSICGAAVTDSASATCSILTTPVIQVTVICPTAPLVPGGSLVYSGVVRNNGDITLNNVVVFSDRPSANSSVFTIASLAPGASANFTATYAVPANACAVTTTFSGVGVNPCSLATVTNTVTTVCGATTTPGIVVTLACPAVSATTGGLITYTGTVRNSGNVALNNVTVVNAQSSPATVFSVATLAPGATANFTSSFTAPSDSCSVSSTVTASGADSCSGALVSNNASATCSLITSPSIVVTQSCPINPVTPGGLLTYNGTVSNAGNITLTNVVVMNNLSGATPVFTIASLAPGASASFTGSYIVVTNCSTTSISTGTARSICGVAVSHAVTSVCSILTTPAIQVTVVCPATPLVPGGSLTYSGVVRNTGNITLVNVVVVSDRPSANSSVFTIASLAPGASANFTSTYAVPATACAVTTTFSGVAKDTCTPTTVTNTVTTTCSIVTAPGIVVTLACPAVSATTGGLITYTGTVRNSGNVTLNNVTVVNAQSSPPTVFTVATLAVGATANFTSSFTAPSDSCSVSSTVTASGADSCSGALVSNNASATCSLITSPGIVVTQLCPIGPTAPGSLLTYSGTVVNSGNITLTNVVVVNNLSGATPIFTIASLAPGATASFTGSYLATTNCSTTSISTATGRSVCGVAVSNTASATCAILTTPVIEVTQTCPALPALQGSTLTYTGTVRNAGNITLTNIVVVDNRPASNTVVFTVATLAPGASVSFTGSYVVPTNCCVVWSTLDARGQGCAGVTVTDTATRSCAVLTLPKLFVSKICAPGVLKAGDVLNYSGIVSNAGNIALINVTVANNQTPGATVFGPVTMAPGESFSYNASYIVPGDFCGTDIVTATGTDVCSFLPVVGSVTTTCAVTTPPSSIAVTKNCPVTPTPRGGLYTFTGTVSNPGKVTLINVYVVDNQPAINTPVIGPITLAPGATVNFSGSYIAPNCFCPIIDTLTARGQDRCTASNVTATATVVCQVLSTPAISVTRVCPALPVPVGGLLVFTGTVKNTGDVVLTNVLVYSSQPNANTLILGPIELAPGESETFSGSYTVVAGSTQANDSVTARGTDIYQSRTVSSAATCLGVLPPVAPRITAIKFANGMVKVFWTTTTGSTYRLQTRPDSTSAWTNVPGDELSTGTLAAKELPIPAGNQWFFRVMLVQ